MKTFYIILIALSVAAMLLYLLFIPSVYLELTWINLLVLGVFGFAVSELKENNNN